MTLAALFATGRGQVGAPPKRRYFVGAGWLRSGPWETVQHLAAVFSVNSLVNSRRFGGLQTGEPEPHRTRVPTCFSGWSGKRGSNPRHPPWQNGSIPWAQLVLIGDDRPRVGLPRLAGWRRMSPVVVWVANEHSVNSGPSWYTTAMSRKYLPKVQRFSGNSLTSTLRRERARKRWTQEKAAEEAGVYPRHYQKLEEGSVNVTIGTLERLSRGLVLMSGRCSSRRCPV
jgi:DNA-binding XRE family transcriptional regulator